MKKVAFITLGCKVNQYETNAMTQQFIEKGYEVVDHTQKADIYIVNTCTVTNMSDRKSRQMLRRVKELNKEAIVVACGCYAQVAKEELEKIEEINLVLGNNGIITKAKDSGVVTRAGSVEDEIELWKADQYLGEETNDTAETEDEMLARLTSNKLITADDEIDTTNKIIKIKKTDGTIVKEISYAYTTNKVTENIFEYTAEGYITGIKDEYLTTTNPDTANVKELVKMANINDNNSIKIAVGLGPEHYLIKELNGEITIPKEIEGIKIIGIDERAFLQIINLTKVTINARIKEIGSEAFYRCESLSTINIPDSVTTIGDSAFGSCSSLSTINIPDSVTTIGKQTFAVCTSLTEITIPNKDITVGAYIFDRGADITVNVPFKEGEQPETWDANWNSTYGDNTITVNYAK